MTRRSTRAVKDPATGELKLVPRKSPPRKDVVFRRLEASVPRAEWLAACEASPDERAQALLMRLTDPLDRAKTLPQLAKEVGLTYAQVLNMVRQYRLDLGLLNMSKHVPQVLEDVAVDAQSTMVPCPGCRGTGKLSHQEPITDDDGKPTFDPETKRMLMKTVEEECWSCEGQGRLRKVGDKAARELMFEALKLTGNRGPLFAQQIVNAGGQTVEDALDTVAQVLDVKPTTTVTTP